MKPHANRAASGWQLRRWLVLTALTLGAFASGCAKRPVIAKRPPSTTSRGPGTTQPTAPTPPSRPLPEPGRPLPAGVYEEGIASWYGIPYHGRRAANGEIYDMHKMTAAHRTLPFDTIVRVTNVKNGKQTEVRINDRGPFVDGRVIDLSFAAAKEIDAVAAGVVPVRLELLQGPHALASKFTVQVGAFSERDNAARYIRALEARYQPVTLHPEDTPRGRLYRVRVGRVASEAEARRLADRLRREEQVTPFIIRLDE
jgi:rare lipoprotein A